MFLFAGLVVDGGLALAAKRRAANEAEAEARAGAQAIDITTYRAGGPFVLNPTRPPPPAHAHLAARAHRDDVRVDADRVP